MQPFIYCDYEFCVYQFRGRCMCDRMRIDETGVCECCLHVEFPESLLNRYKAATRRKEESAEQEYGRRSHDTRQRRELEKALEGAQAGRLLRRL